MLEQTSSFGSATNQLPFAVSDIAVRKDLLGEGVNFVQPLGQVSEREESRFMPQLDLFLNQPRPVFTKQSLERRRRINEREGAITQRLVAETTRGRLRSHFGMWASGDPRFADNDRIDRDLARAYGDKREADD